MCVFRSVKNINICIQPLVRKEFRIGFQCTTATIHPLMQKPHLKSLPPQQSNYGSKLCEGSVSNTSHRNSEHWRCQDLPCAIVSGVAAFPAVKLTDAFCEGWSKAFLWDMMSAEGINTEAASVVSDIEKRMEQVWNRLGHLV